MGWNDVAMSTLGAQKLTVHKKLTRRDASKLSEKQQDPLRALNQRWGEQDLFCVLVHI